MIFIKQTNFFIDIAPLIKVFEYFHFPKFFFRILANEISENDF